MGRFGAKNVSRNGEMRNLTDRAANSTVTSVDQPYVLDLMAGLAKRVLIDEWRGVCKQAAQEVVADSSTSRRAYLWTGRRGRVELGLKHEIEVALAA